MLEALLQRFGMSVEDVFGADGAVLRAEDEGDTFVRAVLRHAFGMEIFAVCERTDRLQFQGDIARQLQRFALAQHLDHAVEVGARIVWSPDVGSAPYIS